MKQRGGFSLLELSIVLVIIGLIAGGIVSGSSMIRAAELRSVITQESQFHIAIHTFRDKYLGMPGDLKNATAFWGAEPAANCPGDETTPSTTSATCDGNGNGQIAWHGAAGFGGESHRFWQHLANAELISGTYTGVHSAGSCNTNGQCNVALGVNAPESSINGVGWSIAYETAIVGNAHPQDFPRPAANTLYLGQVGNFTSNPAFEPSEAWNLDKKNDDGKPGTGRIRTWSPNFGPATNCSTSNDPAVSEYNVSNDTIACPIIVLLD